MIRSLPMLSLLAVAALGVAQSRADNSAPLHLSRQVKADTSNDAEPAMPQPGAASLHVQGKRAAVQIDVRRTRIMEVLAALSAAYGISYRSSIALDKPVDGRYAGSLGQVITRVLEGYDFVISRRGTRLDVRVFGRSGDKPVASPMVAVIRQHRIPVTMRISRNR
jgi:hypothetical protein